MLRRLLTLAFVLAPLSLAISADEGPQKHVLPAAYIQSLETAGERATPAGKAADGFLDWGHFAVNYPGGFCAGVRATSVSVYVDDVEWYYSGDVGSAVWTPAGSGAPASGFAYPNANAFGVVAVQRTGAYWQLTGTTPATANKISGLTNTLGLCFAANDGNGGSGNNWGSFRVHIRVDAQ